MKYIQILHKTVANIALLLCIIFCTLSLIINAQQTVGPMPKATVYQLDITEDIYPATWRKVDRAINEAENLGVTYIILNLNTYGGAVDAADSIRTKLLNTEIPTVVYINNNAASAGALISLACDSIYMSPGAKMGAVTVVNQTGIKMPDKYQSYMRATMRATAEAQNRDPQIAEAMVDESISIPGIIDSTKTLTFTVNEAIKYGYCEGEFPSMNDVLKRLNVADYEKITYKESLTDRLIGWLINPFVQSFLLFILVWGIFFELKTPGVGFPIAAALIAAILYFAPSYLEGLAQNWEILLFIVGLVLIGLEIFVVPGLGITGAAGIVCIITGLVLSTISNNFFDFSGITTTDSIRSIAIVAIPFIFGLILLLTMSGKLIDAGYFKRVALNTSQEAAAGYTVEQKSLSLLVGKTGNTVTPLRPSGKVDINGEVYDAITEGEWISSNEPIVVKNYQSSYLIVKAELV